MSDDPVTMRDVDDRINEALEDEIGPYGLPDYAGQLEAHHSDIGDLNERLEDLAGQLRAALARVDAITPCPCQTSVYVALPLRDDERPTG
jgi:hypothetical protein